MAATIAVEATLDIDDFAVNGEGAVDALPIDQAVRGRFVCSIECRRGWVLLIGFAGFLQRVHEGKRDAGHPRGRPAGTPCEDDILHFLGSERFGGSLAQHPFYRVDDIRFAAAVGPDNRGDGVIEGELGSIREGFEPDERDLCKSHHLGGLHAYVTARGRAIAPLRTDPIHGVERVYRFVSQRASHHEWVNSKTPTDRRAPVL